MSIQAVIWDVGGVLLRTEDRGPRTALARRFGMTYEEIDELVFGCETALQAAEGKIDVSAHWENVCRQLNLPPEEASTLQESFWGGDRMDEELVTFIRGLRPRYRTALLSNAWSDMRSVLDRKWKILDAFDDVFISSEIGLVKPDPRIYIYVAEKMGIEPGQAVFIDDFKENVDRALKVGFHGVHFQNPAQAIQDVRKVLEEHS